MNAWQFSLISVGKADPHPLGCYGFSALDLTPPVFSQSPSLYTIQGSAIIYLPDFGLNAHCTNLQDSSSADHLSKKKTRQKALEKIVKIWKVVFKHVWLGITV